MIKLAKRLKDTNLADEDKTELLFDAYKEFYRELKMEISKLRKEQKNPIIPDLMIRKIPSKIQYAEVTKEKEDVAAVEIGLLEVLKEVIICSYEEQIDIKKELEHKFNEDMGIVEEEEV